MPNTNKQALFTLYLAAFLLACNGLFAKGIPLDASSITQLRSVVAVVAVSVFLLLCRKTLSLPTRNDYFKTYFVGILLGLHWVTFFAAMQISSIAIGMVALFSYPVITVLLEPAVNKQRPKAKDIIAAAVVLLGVFIMMPENNGSGSWQLNANTAAGVGLGLMSAVLFSVRNVIQGRILTNIDASSSILHQLLIIGLLLIPFVDWSAAQSLAGIDIAKLIVLGAVTTAIAHILLASSLRYLPAKSVAMIGCIQPPLGALFGWLILSEMVSTQVFLGGAIVLSVAVYETWQSR